eukprot:13250121-Ditylum_brightwellii.AAC.1
MNRAVAARLENSDLTLLEALRAGGFEWCSDVDSDSSRDKIIDFDGVSLSQRKNQLNRRLRQHKKKIALGTCKKNRAQLSKLKRQNKKEIQHKNPNVDTFPFSSVDNSVDDGHAQ